MPKTLIICADGTWNSENEADHGHPCPTNVTKIARAVLPTNDQGETQVVYYHSGVGTRFDERVQGGALGAGLFNNVVDCYRFLIHNYQPEDKLYFFGFSRGAFTVRSLAGLIRNSGIVKRGHEGFESLAIDLYRDTSDATLPDADASKKFRAEHSIEATIHFLGVWDTVGALGIPNLRSDAGLPSAIRWQFHDVSLSRSIRNAYHALSIHEHRAEFVPTLWEQQEGARDGGQILEQVWFSGAHSDVGGGYYPETGLSDVALEWMARKVIKCGLNLDTAFLSDSVSFAPNPLGEGHDSFSFFYKFLDFVEGKKGGTMRVYNQNSEQTCQDIHPSVIVRFKEKSPSEKWPQSFADALAALK